MASETITRYTCDRCKKTAEVAYRGDYQADTWPEGWRAVITSKQVPNVKNDCDVARVLEHDLLVCDGCYADFEELVFGQRLQDSGQA